MLLDREETYRNLFIDAQVALFRIRMSDGALIAANHRYANMAGYSTIEECMEKYNPGESWVNPGDREEFFRLLRKTNVVSNYEREFLCGDGKRI